MAKTPNKSAGGSAASGGEAGLFRVAVIGEFSTGKSSLLNLVANEPLLPASVEYSEMPPISLTWGQQRTLALVTRKGKRVFGAFSDLSAGEWSGSDRISVELPERGIAGIEFLEIPLHPGAEFADAVLPMLARADMVVWCTSSNQALKLTEVAAIESIPPELLKRSVLAATRADLLDASDREKVMRRLKRELGEKFGAILLTSASRQLCETAYDPEIWTESGGEALMQAIRAHAGYPAAADDEDDEDEPQAANRPGGGSGDGKVVPLSPKFSTLVRPAAPGTAPAAAKVPAAALPAAQKGAAPGAMPPQGRVSEPPPAGGAADASDEPDLTPLAGLGGFAGAVLVDSVSGLVLLGDETPVMKLAAATSGAAAAVAAAEPADSASAEILIATGSLYHLVRPLISNPRVYLYLVLSRAEANLGLARMMAKTLAARIDLS